MSISEKIEQLVERFILRMYGRRILQNLAAQEDFTPEQAAIIEAVGNEPYQP